MGSRSCGEGIRGILEPMELCHKIIIIKNNKNLKKKIKTLLLWIQVKWDLPWALTMWSLPVPAPSQCPALQPQAHSWSLKRMGPILFFTWRALLSNTFPLGSLFAPGEVFYDTLTPPSVAGVSYSPDTACVVWDADKTVLHRVPKGHSVRSTPLGLAN